MLELSEHASRRCSQRGIPEPLVIRILAHADRERPCGGGCVAFEISNKERARLRATYGSEMERCRSVIVLVSGNGTVVTVFRASDRRRARRYRIR